MTPDRWARAQEILHDALDAAPAHRAALIARRAGDDDGLRQEVESLLAAHDRNSLLDVAEPRPSRRPTPAMGQIGPYRLVRPLGEGGMGTVYLAERGGEGFTQMVALKLLRGGFVDPRLEERLRVERRLLARLEHPGIARLIDGGATSAGQPYVVLEYVEGLNLLEYCDRHGLAVGDRVRLFLEVCDAVHYAHQQLVVHRDLKPGNIFVTAAGRPKLLDFGIAKALDPDAGVDAAHTVPWFTPAYASPEQVRGQPVGTPSDVYALGVVLYELLTGRRPLEVEAAISPAELEALVCRQAPLRPSAACPSRARGLAGDLDTIVLKALAKEPERRYASAEQLADDLRHYLGGRPVLARPDTFRYRAAKFVHRHRTAVAAGALAAAAALVGVGATVWQGTVARRERDRAEAALAESQQVTEFLIGLFEASDPRYGARDTAVAREILRRGVARADELAGQPVVQARMLDALGMVFVTLGQYDRAYELIGRGRDLRVGALGPRHPDVALSERHRARALRALARYQEALDALQAALAIQRAELDPDDPEVGATLMDLGFLMPYLGRLEDAEAFYREALDLYRRVLGPEHPLVADALMGVAGIQGRRGDLEEGVRGLRQAVELRRRMLGPEHVQTAIAMVFLGDALLEADSTAAEAERLFRSALAIQRRALGGEDLTLVHGLGSLADALIRRRAYAEAEAVQREALAINTQLLGADHPETAGSIGGVADVLRRQGRLDEALAMYRDALARWRRAVGPRHSAVAGAMGGVSDVLADLGRYAEAEAARREALAIRIRNHGPEHVLAGLEWSRLGQLLTRSGQYAAADSALRTGVAILSRHMRPEHPDVRRAHAALADLYARMGRPAEAAQYRALAGR